MVAQYTSAERAVANRAIVTRMRDAILKMTWIDVVELALDKQDKAWFERVRSDICSSKNKHSNHFRKLLGF